MTMKIMAAVLVLTVTSMSLYETYNVSQVFDAMPLLSGARLTVEARIYQGICGLLAAASAIYLMRAILGIWRSHRL
ncbi:hypothetical protein FHS96_005477 [Sphingomonas zeicaulis]|uniref:hypothetical protein n=1 Tax=Sphingomonas zeicaulis TaxID=1632740 RepID=UPI003D239903